MTDLPTKSSPLHDHHVALGAKMADFGGWSMPIEYSGSGVVAEHTAVRERVGIFDVSHLGKAVVTGPAAVDFINRTLTNDIHRIEAGAAQYTMCCADDGGVIDDLIVYRVSDDEVFLMPNAANTSGVVAALADAAPEEITVAGCHEDFVVIAVQGPRSEAVLTHMGLPTSHGYMTFVDADWGGATVRVCRTGYTGEKGYELVANTSDADALWSHLTEATTAEEGLVCGLGARDTLRTEMGYPLHGHELSPEISPIMARSGWAVGWDKPTFWGKEALLAQRHDKAGPILRGLVITARGIPRADCCVKTADGADVGVVTSGTFSPTLKQGIALAMLDRSVEMESDVSVEVRGRLIPARVVRPPFVAVNTR